MEISCDIWNYILGSTSITLFFCNVIQLVFLARFWKKQNLFRLLIYQLTKYIEVISPDSNDKSLDILKEARKLGTGIKVEKGDNYHRQEEITLDASALTENIYETIRDKNSKMLIAVRDSVSIRMKQNISNTKGRNKVVTFSSGQFEVIPDTLEEVTSEEVTSVAPPLPPKNPVETSESYYMEMGQNSRAVTGADKGHSETDDTNLQQIMHRDPTHIYAKCNKDKTKNQSVEQPHKPDVEVVMSVECGTKPSEGNVTERTSCGYINEVCEDEYDEDELYDKQCEILASATEGQPSLKGNLKNEDKSPKNAPKIPRKQNSLSRVKVFGTEQDQQGISPEIKLPLDNNMYDIPPSRQPRASNADDIENVPPPTPHCGRKSSQPPASFNKPDPEVKTVQGSPLPSRLKVTPEVKTKPSKDSRKSKSSLLHRLQNATLKKTSEPKTNADENLTDDSELFPEDLESAATFSALVQNSFYAGSSLTMKREVLGMRPSLTDIHLVQDRLNMIDYPPGNLRGSHIATPPILRRPSNAGLSNVECTDS